MKRFFALIAAVSLTIAALFSLHGFWPVLPFAGAELAFLWFCLHYNATRGQDTEVIDIDDRTVAVERGRGTPSHRWDFERAWTRISLEAPRARLHPHRLLLGSHGKAVRLGQFLTDDELVDLAHDLKDTLARH